MAIPVVLPQCGQSVESCILTKWHKKAGEAVRTGEPLFTYETDKAVFDEEAKVAGTLLAVFFEEQEEAPCLSCVAVIGEAGEEFERFRPAPVQRQAKIPTRRAVDNGSMARGGGNTPRAASPRARGLAAQLGVELGGLMASGPNGRIVERDVRAAAPRSAAAPAFTKGAYRETPLTNARKTAAGRMSSSMLEAPQSTHHVSFDAGPLLALRARLKGRGDDWAAVSINDMLLYACARVLPQYAALNAHFYDNTLREYASVHIGIAVDTPRCLLAPTLFFANEKGLREIAAEAAALTAAARSGAIGLEDLSGATFTVSNLGPLGVEFFTPILNTPQTAILGVGCMVERPRSANGGIALYPAMGLSLTYDHRAVDGAPVGRFLRELTQTLENCLTWEDVADV